MNIHQYLISKTKDVYTNFLNPFTLQCKINSFISEI